MWIHCSTDFRLRLRVVYLRETSTEGGIIAELSKTTQGGGNLGGTVQNDKVRGTDFGLEL